MAGFFHILKRYSTEKIKFGAFVLTILFLMVFPVIFPVELDAKRGFLPKFFFVESKNTQNHDKVTYKKVPPVQVKEEKPENNSEPITQENESSTTAVIPSDHVDNSELPIPTPTPTSITPPISSTPTSTPEISHATEPEEPARIPVRMPVTHEEKDEERNIDESENDTDVEKLGCLGGPVGCKFLQRFSDN